MPVSDRAACAAHEKHRRTCGACAVAEMDAMVARDYPPALVEPWQHRVTQELGELWQAYVRPVSLHSVSGQPIWTLRYASGYPKGEDVTYEFTLSGTDQDRLLAAAVNLMAEV